MKRLRQLCCRKRLFNDKLSIRKQLTISFTAFVIAAYFITLLSAGIVVYVLGIDAYNIAAKEITTVTNANAIINARELASSIKAQLQLNANSVRISTAL